MQTRFRARVHWRPPGGLLTAPVKSGQRLDLACLPLAAQQRMRSARLKKNGMTLSDWSSSKKKSGKAPVRELLWRHVPRHAAGQDALAHGVLDRLRRLQPPLAAHCQPSAPSSPR